MKPFQSPATENTPQNVPQLEITRRYLPWNKYPRIQIENPQLHIFSDHFRSPPTVDWYLMHVSS